MIQRWLTSRLALPVAILLTAAIVAGTVIDSLVSMSSARAQLRDQTINAATSIHKLTRNTSGDFSPAMQMELSRYMDLLCDSQKTLSHCYITDVSQRIVAHNQRENIGRTINPDLLSHRQDYGQRREVLVPIGSYLETIVPIEHHGQWLGAVHVGIERRQWIAAGGGLASLRLILFAGVAATVLIAVVVFIERRVLMPIRKAIPRKDDCDPESLSVTDYAGALQNALLSMTRRIDTQEVATHVQNTVLEMCGHRHTAFVVVDMNGRLIHCNDAFRQLCELQSFDDGRAILNAVAGVCHGAMHLQSQWQALLKDPLARESGECHTKHDRPLIWDSVPIIDRQGQFLGRLWRFRDANSPSAYDDLLGTSERGYSPMLDMVSDLLCYLDSTMTVRWMNRAALTLLGRSLDEVVGQKCHVLWHGKSKPCQACPAMRCMLTHAAAEGQISDDDGHSTYITAHPIIDPHGIVIGAIEIVQNITELVQTEKQHAKHQQYLETVLRERTEELNGLVNLNPSGVVILDASSGQILRVNDALCAMVGLSSTQLEFQPCDILGEAIHKTLPESVISDTTETLLHTNFMTNIPVTRTLSRFTVVGRPHILVSYTDISERKAFESRLTARNEELNTMNQTLQASEMVLRTQNRELSGRMRELNCLFELGKLIASPNATLDNILQHATTILTSAVQYPQIACARITYEGQDFATPHFRDTEWSMEAAISQRDHVYGQITVCYLHQPEESLGTPFQTEERALLMSFAAQLAQLAERYKAEQTLQENERRFRTLVSNVPGAVYRAIPDRDRTMNYISQAVTDITGYVPDDFMVGQVRTYMSIVHPDDRDMVLKAIDDAAQQGLSYAIEYRLIHSDGWIRWVYDKGHCIYDDQKLLWLDGAVFDITDRKNAEDTLTRQKDLLGNILSTIPLLVSWKDRSIRYMGCNDAMARAAGYSRPEDIIGKNDFDMPWTVEQAEEYQKNDTTVLTTGRPLMNMEEKQTHLDGSERTVLTSKVPLRNPQSEVIGVLTIGVDITERKLLESQLIQAQKLESIGQLASGIAHEINTPTQYIGDNVRFLRDKIADIVELLAKHSQLVERLKEQNACMDLVGEIEEEMKEINLEFLCEEIPLAINDSLDGIDRVSDIVRAMKEFSHPGGEGKTEQDLNRAIHNTITVARNRWKYVAELDTHFDPALPPVTCLINELNQVVLNLIVNAADAIGEKLAGHTDEKGKITVSTKHVGRFVEIYVSDTGGGIPESIRSRIFDPFFTTKDVGKGTGQGLAICHDIITKKHNGEIFFQSDPGKGTTFTIRLPLDPEADHADCGEVQTCPKTE